jgi:hypothetical protein
MAVDIGATIKQVRHDDKAVRPYLLSAHRSYSLGEREQILIDHAKSQWLCELGRHFADLAMIWDAIPTAYLKVLGTKRVKKSNLQKEVKEILRTCAHRYLRPALFIQATLFSLECRIGNLGFASDIEIPDPNDVLCYPDTEKSRRAAGFVVTSCGSMIHIVHSENEFGLQWQREFWNSCFRLEPCEYE